ncbi:MAG: hypothetical protein KIT84_29345 [Labilithrix sp.]|nr:hypothetical protein [Labilithrix sp.]MCW5815168.1 hypothetical protein [Labilithrix sp.]
MTRLTAVLALVALAACSPEAGGSERVDQGDDDDDDGASGDGAVDPTGGRKANPVDCLSSCQNAFLTCFPKGAKEQTPLSLRLDEGGCIGTYGIDQELTIRCKDLEVCVDGACSDGTFSPLQFAFTPSSGVETVCYRD